MTRSPWLSPHSGPEMARTAALPTPRRRDVPSPPGSCEQSCWYRHSSHHPGPACHLPCQGLAWAPPGRHCLSEAGSHRSPAVWPGASSTASEPPPRPVTASPPAPASVPLSFFPLPTVDISLPILSPTFLALGAALRKLCHRRWPCFHFPQNLPTGKSKCLPLLESLREATSRSQR